VIRLVRVKFLYRAAVDELDSGHPFAAGMAISLLQDAVEAMAHEAAASVHATIGARANFLDHWDAVASAGAGKKLPYKIEMTELNVARVGFKHQGVNPATSDAEKHGTAAHRFLAETAKEFFATDFDELSEADLIANADIRATSKLAEQALTADDPTKALEHCRNALDTVESLMRSAIVVSEQDHFGPPVPREFRAAAADLVEWTLRRFTALEKSVALSFLNINPADYWFLYDSLPLRTLGGTFVWRFAGSPIPHRTAQRAQACIRIIIDLALRVERFHADMQRLSVRSGMVEEQRRLKEWQDKTLSQPIPDTSDPPPG
jgi:hypothetical protein